MYDVIKNERNKCVNLIQTSTQKAAEMKEKIKILQNEIEILRTAVSLKDRLVLWHVNYDKMCAMLLSEADELNELHSSIFLTTAGNPVHQLRNLDLHLLVNDTLTCTSFYFIITL
jgi:fructose-1,6-bisphosphatase